MAVHTAVAVLSCEVLIRTDLLELGVVDAFDRCAGS